MTLSCINSPTTSLIASLSSAIASIKWQHTHCTLPWRWIQWCKQRLVKSNACALTFYLVVACTSAAAAVIFIFCQSSTLHDMIVDEAIDSLHINIVHRFMVGNRGINKHDTSAWSLLERGTKSANLLRNTITVHTIYQGTNHSMFTEHWNHFEVDAANGTIGGGDSRYNTFWHSGGIFVQSTKPKRNMIWVSRKRGKSCIAIAAEMRCYRNN